MARFQNALVVDDSKLARFALTRAVGKLGLHVDDVGSGEEALEYLKQKKPDIIFMDFQMPGLDGYETSSIIHADSATAHIPIIICTGQEDLRAELVHAKESGASTVLKKPVSEEDIKNAMQKLEGTDTATASTSGDVGGMLQQQSEAIVKEVVDAVSARIPGDAAAKIARHTALLTLQRVQKLISDN